MLFVVSLPRCALAFWRFSLQAFSYVQGTLAHVRLLLPKRVSLMFSSRYDLPVERIAVAENVWSHNHQKMQRQDPVTVNKTRSLSFFDLSDP
jgi:hypothetical protein